ncbi:MAG: hypothetical protein IJ642_05605, partial [Oscillospiraceae bacterium]|nr:hypothetical protein [Oscillospiraceae bacterium]
QIDFPALLRQSVAEVLAMRKDVETAEYFPVDVPYQPDIAVRTKPLQKPDSDKKIRQAENYALVSG